MPSYYSFTPENAWKHSGDKEKFACLYQTYHSYMYQVAYSLLWNPSLAEDAVQEAFLKLIRYLDRVEEVDAISTRNYIRAIVQTIVFTMQKKGRKESLYENAFFEEACEIKTNSPEFQALKKEQIRYTRQFLAELKPKDRNCIYLYYFQEQTVLQIASILDISSAAVRNRLKRGRDTLRKRLKQEGLL